MISLTGDVASGEKVLQAAAKGPKRTHLELGGKAPVIVFDDADLAVRGRWRAHVWLLQRRAGLHGCLPHLRRPPRSTTSSLRILAARSSSIKVGKQKEEGVEMGPLISAKQRNRVAGFVRARGG